MAYSTAAGAVISVSIDGVAQTQAGLERVAASMDAMSTRTTASAAQMANAMRMVPAQLTDIIVGLQAGQSPLTVLLQQGGQLRDMFGSVGGAARGVAAALANLINPYTIAAAAAGALAYAYNQGAKEADAYNKAIIMTGNAAGTSRDQLADYARDISKLVGTQGQAAQALSVLAGTGEVGSANLKQFGAVAVQVQKYIGRSVEDTAKDLAELGKSPLEASVKLSESYHYLTSAVYEQIKALQDQGKSDEAAEVAQKAYSRAFEDRANKLKDELGGIERAWMGAKDTASKAWDAFLGIGRKTTPQQALAKIDEQLALLPEKGGTASERGIRAGLLKQRIQLQYEVDKGQWDTQQAAISEQLRKAGLEWDKVMEGTLSKADRMRLALKKVEEQGLAAGASDDAIRAAKKKVEQDYAALDNPLLARLEGNRTVQREVLAGQLQDLENSYKLQLTSEKDYLAQKGEMQLKELDLEIGIIKQRKAIDQGKEDKSAYWKDDAELRAAIERRKNLVNATAQAIAGVDFQSKKSIDALVDGWSRAILVEREAADQEVTLFGQTGQARQTALAQLKLEADARKLIADRKRENKPMTEQEIADLNATTEAKKRDLAVELNRRAALAGAEQLLDANRKFGIEYIADEKQRAAAQLSIEAEKWQQLLRLAGEGTDAQKLLQQQYDTWYRNELLRPQLDEQKRIWQAVENTAHDAFIGVFDSGKSAFDRLRDTLKNGLLELLYQMTMKKWIISVGASVGIGGMAGVAQAGNGGTGDLFAQPQAVSNDPLMNAVTSATSLYKAISGAASGFGSSLASGAGQAVTWLGDKLGSEAFATFGKGMQGFGLDGSLGSMAGYGQAAGAFLSKAGGTAAGYMVGSTLNSAISGQYQTGSGVMTAEKIATAVASYVAGPIGGAVAGAVSGLFNRAFGMGDKKVTAQGMRGTLTADSLTGTNYANWHQDGGWFRSDRNGTDLTALAADTVKQFTQGLSAIESASSGFASALGVQADWIKDYSKVFDIAMSGDATKDQQAITDFFTGIGNEIANRLVPNLDQFSKSGEAAAATLERLAGDFQGTDRVAQLLGVSSDALFGASGMQSASAREQLIDLAGGLDVLGQQASFFNQNFLTDAERIAPVAKSLDKALASLGLTTIPKTRTEFAGLVRNLIASGAAATATGAKQLDSLLALGEAFAQVHPDDAAEAAAKASRILQERQQLMDELDQLTLSSAAGLQKQRDALDESNRALFDQVQAVKAQQAAIEATKARATTLLSGVDSAYGVLQKVVAREKTALQSNIDTHTAAANKLRSLSQALRSTLDGMRGPEQQLADRRNAQAQIRTALAIARAGGPLPDADALKKALSSVQQDAADQFSSYNDYLRDFYQTQADIADLASITDDSLSIEEKSLDALNKQLDGLDGILATAQDQIDVLKGQSTTLLSIDQAINGLAVAMQSARGNSVVAATSAIASAYQNALGRPADQSGLEFWQNQAAAGTSTADIINAITTSPEARLQGMYQATLGRPGDAAGLQFWMQQLASGTSYSAVQSALTDSDEYRRLHPFAVGTNYVPRTMPALVHEGERIVPAADNRALMARLASPTSGSGDNAVLVAEIRRLRETVEQQQRVLTRIAESTGRHVELFDNATAGGGPLLVEMA